MQITNYRNAVAKLKGILDNRASYLIIHYSCESFRERNQAKSPRITSIAIRSLESGQIESFSIHKIAAAILTVLSMIGGIILGRLSNYIFPF